MKRRLLQSLSVLLALAWFGSVGYVAWFDHHTHHERMRADELPFRSKGTIHWATPDEVRRETLVEWVGIGGPMVTLLIVGLLKTKPERAGAPSLSQGR